MRPLVITLCALAATSSAAAQSVCFTPVAPERGASTHLVVGPAARFRSVERCRYGVRLRGSADLPTSTLPIEARDVAEFFAELRAPRDQLAARLEVVARTDAEPPQVETLSLRPCVTGLGEGSTVVRFDAAGETVRVRTISAGAQCPVAESELVLVPVETDATTMTGAPPEGARVLSLANAAESSFAGDQRAWAAYVRRRGSNAAVRIDTLHFGDPRTALRQRFATPGALPWFRAGWDRGALRFAPDARVFEDTDVAWAEMVSASSAHAVFVATNITADGADVQTLPFDVDGSAALAPEELVRASMRARYGVLGPSMVPARADWNHALASARLCHRGTYSDTPDRSARVTAEQLDRLNCRTLAQLSAVSDETLAPATLERRLDAIGYGTEVTVTQGADAVNEALPLDGDGRVRFVTPGDTFRAPATLPAGRVLTLCRVASDVANAEAVTLAAGATHVFTEASAGVWQAVLRPAGEATCTGHDLALARVAVVSPRTDWIPVGLQQHGVMDLRAPWRSVETSGDDTFAFYARSGVPEFRIAASREVSAAVNGWQPDPTADPSVDAPRLASALPVVLPAEPSLTSPAPSALAVLLSTNDRCPDQGNGLLANLRGLPAESTFYAYLVARNPPGDGHRFACLSRATLRVVPPLVHRGSSAGPFYVRWGTPGPVSARAHWEVLGTCANTRCLSFGVAVPLIYARISPSSHGASWVGMEFSLPLVLAASPGDGRALHTGLGVDVAFTLGPHALPRLVSLGVLFQPTFLGVGPAQSDASVDLAPYLGVNLNSIVDAIRSE
jgi:hypothetical protein